jgi:hypothetical protein
MNGTQPRSDVQVCDTGKAMSGRLQQRHAHTYSEHRQIPPPRHVTARSHARVVQPRQLERLRERRLVQRQARSTPHELQEEALLALRHRGQHLHRDTDATSVPGNRSQRTTTGANTTAVARCDR